MSKILIVDDEPAQARGLSRAILLRRPEYSVLTAGSGEEAIALLCEQQVDLVITDLQMAEMSGFDFLAWLFSNRPHVLAFAMTAYANEESEQRLSDLGTVECFTKPLDVDALVSRTSDGLSQSIRGHVHNVGLASFLQLVELEQKTCTLEVRCDGQVGQLFVRKGELFDAQTKALSGEEAAVAILGWLNASISIDSQCKVSARAIFKPAYHVVMEAMRVRDESIRPRSGNGEAAGVPRMFASPLPPRTSMFPLLFGSERPIQVASSHQPSLQILESLHVPVGALGLAMVEIASGKVLTVRDQPDLRLAELAQGALQVVRQEQTTLGLSSSADTKLEELVMVTSSRVELIRPLPDGNTFVFLVFDSGETNLVMARLELDLFVVEYCAA